MNNSPSIALASRLKTMLRNGEVCVGSWVMTRDPITVEVMAAAGFAWLCVDLEHAPIELSIAADLIRTGTLSGTPMLVRMPSHDIVLAKKLADAGASGFIFPDVRTPEQIRGLITGLRYPGSRKGERGVGLGRGAGFGRQFDSYFGAWNDSVVIIPQIEHIDAVKVVGDIAAVDGVDALFVGPYDLSASLGLPGQINHPKVDEALKHIVAAATEKGKVAGFHAVPADQDAALARIRDGARFLAFSADIFILRDVCDRFIAAARQSSPNR